MMMDAGVLSQENVCTSTLVNTAMKNVTTLGQVFTSMQVVECMLGLRRNRGRVLEPSAGNGAFSSRLSDCTAIELDAAHCPLGAMNTDFFDYSVEEKFETIIGNPPYVRFQDISPSTKRLLNLSLFDRRSNLYLFFIEKCIHHLKPGGELIFITPRDFIKTTGAVKMNRFLFEQGTITHAIDLGDVKCFDNAVPNCLIWRFQKGLFDRRMRYAQIGAGQSLAALSNVKWENHYFLECAGHLMFTRGQYPFRLSDIFFVKVGAVSGDDKVFTHAQLGNLDFVCSETAKTGKLRRMIYNQRIPYLDTFKERLLGRRIRSFDESNWWMWGRGYYVSDRPRIYVNGKTRNSQPFFLHNSPHYDGSILAVFPRDPATDVRKLCAALNNVDWADLGFICDGRYLFSQRSLENAPLPESFATFLTAHAAAA